MVHLDELTLELFVLGEENSIERDSIAAHLHSCRGCRETYELIASFHGDVAADFENSDDRLAIQHRENLPSRVGHRSSLRRADRPPLREVEVSLPFRAARWVVRHPFTAGATGLLTFIGMVVLLITTFQRPTPAITDRNPTIVEIAGEYIQLKNRKGELIENIHVESVTGGKLIPHGRIYSDPVLLADIDHDGFNEVIWDQGNENVRHSTVVCMSVREKRILWSYPLLRTLRFPGKKDAISDEYISRVIASGDHDADGLKEVYIVASNDLFPSFLVKLDGKTGTELGSYVHSGHLPSMQFLDLDGDGRNEIILAGINNGLESACVVVIDPRHLSGHAPSTDSYLPADLPRGTEKAYIRIPKGVIGRTIGDEVRWNIAHLTYISTSDTTFTIKVNDAHSQKRALVAWLYYSFNRYLVPVRMETGDDFDLLYSQLVKEGRLPANSRQQHLDDYRQGLLYWDGYEWSRSPVTNRLYLQTLAKQKHPG